MDFERWRDWTGQDVASFVSAFGGLPQYSQAISQNVTGPGLEQMLKGGMISKGLARAGVCDHEHQKKIASVLLQLTTAEPEALRQEFAQLRSQDTTPVAYPPVPRADPTKKQLPGAAVCSSTAWMPKPPQKELRLHRLGTDPGVKHRSTDRMTAALYDDVPPDAPKPREPKAEVEAADGDEDEQEEVHLLPGQKLRAELAMHTGQYRSMCFLHPDLACGAGSRGAQALKEQQAATKIQAMHRGKKSRQRVQGIRDERHREEETAATRIQSLHRGKKSRREVEAAKEQKLREARERYEQSAAATKLQAAHRGRTARAQVKSMREGGGDAKTDLSPPAGEVVNIEGTDEEQAAALRIQSLKRGKDARREVEQKKQQKEEAAAAVKIQAAHRGNKARKELHGREVSLDAMEPISPTDEAASGDAAPAAASGQPEELPEGTEEEHAAAARIQAIQRGKQARKEVEGKRASAGAQPAAQEEPLPEGTDEEQAAAARIQAVHRGKQARKEVAEKRAGAGASADAAEEEALPEGTDEEHAAAARIQAVHRGKQARKEVDDRKAAADS